MDILPDTSITVYGTDFYVLNPGDKFRISNTKYKKIDESFAQLANGKKKINLWPQQGVKFLKPINKKEYYEKYPFLEYYR